MSLRIIAPIVIIPAAPSPQTARATRKLSILGDKAHQIVARVKTVQPKTMGILRPMTSLILPKRGWKLTAVNKKLVDNQLASSEELKEDVMVACVEAIIVLSKPAMKLAVRMAMTIV